MYDVYWQVALVDSVDAFAGTHEHELGVRLAKADPPLLGGAYSVQGFPSVEGFLSAARDYPLVLPLLVVADTDARKPSIREGVFSKVRRVIPRTKTIFYSSAATEQDMEQMFELHVMDNFIRRGPDSVEKLAGEVEIAFRAFEKSMEFRIIRRFAEAMNTTPHPKVSSVGGNEDMSPYNVLVEMLRGTDNGRFYLEALWDPLAVGTSNSGIH